MLAVKKSLNVFYELSVKGTMFQYTTVWYEIIFRHLNGYNSANIADIDKISFDNCLDINS